VSHIIADDSCISNYLRAGGPLLIGHSVPPAKPHAAVDCQPMDDPGRTASCLVRRDGGEVRELRPDQFGEIDALRAEPGTVVWLALRDPDPGDLRLLEQEFGVHELALEDVQKRGQRPKLDTYPDQHMVVVFEALPARGRDAIAPAPGGIGESTPAGGDAGGTFELAELHAFVGRGWLVTVQWHDSPAVAAARTRVERSSSGPDRGAGSILYWLFDAAADSYFPILDAMAERMDALEDRVLAGARGDQGLAEMLTIKRELLELRRVLAPMRDVANALLRRDIPVIDDAAEPYFQDLYDHLVRILDQLDLYRDLLASVVDARLTLTSNALNTVMKRLTAITVILMAPTLVAGIYGMNFDVMPELHWVLGYPFALAVMAATMVGAFLFFRSRDWF